MHAHDSSLITKAFGARADAQLIVPYQSHQDALRFLASALGQANGIALLQGPKGSGKTRIVKEQLDWSSRDAAVALVDGNRLTPRRMITEMLSQFGIQTVTQHDEQMLQLLNKFVTQQTLDGQAPVLIFENADRATSSVLRLLNWLAALDSRGEYTLRMIVTGRERLSVLLRHNSMRGLARRHPATYSLNPLSPQETMIYLRTRLIAAGGERSEEVFPIDVCEQLRESSSGWPGPLNERAIEVMERMTELQSAKPIPRIVVTCDGETVSEHDLTERQYVIGRSGLADIVIEDSYVSKTHAMLQIYKNAIVMIDLNSTNGTTVNSKEVPKTVLRNNDIISLGRHRLKVENAPALSAQAEEKISASDTLTMQTLDDLRRSRARRTITALKHKLPG